MSSHGLYGPIDLFVIETTETLSDWLQLRPIDQLGVLYETRKK